MQLVVGLALQQPAAVARAQHLLAAPPCDRRRAAAAGSAGSWPPPARRRRSTCTGRCRSTRPRASGSSSSARSSASLMRLPSRAAASFSSRSTRHCTRARVGAAEVEPGLGVVWRSRSVHASVLAIAASTAVENSSSSARLSGSSWIRHQSAVASSTSQASGGAGRHGAAQLGVDLVESRVEDDVVGAARAPSTPRIGAAAGRGAHAAAVSDAAPTTRATAARATRLPSCDAGAQLLLLGVPLERERDQPIEQRRVVDAGRLPQLRVHADRREARESC